MSEAGRILFILKSEKTPSSRIRFIDLLPFLSSRGMEFEVEYLPSSWRCRHRLFKRGREFDIIVLQKRLPSWWDFRVLRENAKTLVFDFDDAVYLRNASPSSNPKDYESATRRKRFARIARESDLLIAANSVLAAAAADTAPGAKVEIIPSSVDVTAFPPVDKERALSSPPVVGWVGTKAASSHLLHFAPMLRAAREKRDFVLRIVSNESFDIPGLKVENKRWSLEGEAELIRSFDIGIMPLSDDPYSRGKSSYKMLQYMAAGVPALASAVGMNSDVAGQERANAALAPTPAEFDAKLVELLDNEKLRSALAERGRKTVEERFSRQVVGQQFATILKKTAGMKSH